MAEIDGRLIERITRRGSAQVQDLFCGFSFKVLLRNSPHPSGQKQKGGYRENKSLDFHGNNLLFVCFHLKVAPWTTGQIAKTVNSDVLASCRLRNNRPEKAISHESADTGEKEKATPPAFQSAKIIGMLNLLKRA